MGKFNQLRVFSINWQCPWCHFLPDGCRCYPGAVTGGSLRHIHFEYIILIFICMSLRNSYSMIMLITKKVNKIKLGLEQKIYNEKGRFSAKVS